MRHAGGPHLLLRVSNWFPKTLAANAFAHAVRGEVIEFPGSDLLAERGIHMRRPFAHRPIRSLACLALVLAACQSASAGGFYAPYQSGKAMGTALAGCSARSDDASFFFCNPATIGGLDGPSAVIDTKLFAPSVKIEANSAFSPLGANLSAAGGSGEMTETAFAPTFFAAIPIASDLWLGLGATGHFAVDIAANPGWAGRFHLIETDMTGINITAALAWRAAPWITISAGVQAQQFDAQFTKSELIPTPFGFVEALGYLDGEDRAFGAVAGILLTPGEGTRIGIGYRSALTHHMRGEAGAVLPGIPVETATFDVDLPHIVTLGIEQRVNPHLRLFAEGQWVGWSRFKGFDIAFGSGRPNELRAQTWDDTWLLAAGFGYLLRPGTELTAGIHYDTAVTDGGTNTLSPDGARTTIAIGFTHKIDHNATISAQYAHVFFEDAAINVAGPTSGTLNGVYEAELDTFGVNVAINW